MTFVSLAHATATDKESLLGREFRSIHVIGADFARQITSVILDGGRVHLIGDPQQALATYLAGKSQTETLQ